MFAVEISDRMPLGCTGLPYPEIELVFGRLSLAGGQKEDVVTDARAAILLLGSARSRKRSSPQAAEYAGLPLRFRERVLGRS